MPWVLKTFKAKYGGVENLAGFGFENRRIRHSCARYKQSAPKSSRALPGRFFMGRFVYSDEC
jgi:hypothetical protein